MDWWLWVLVGFGLLLLEMATPGGFFAIFFGIAAVLVGGLAWPGWAGPAWLQWLLFSAISVVGLLLFRAPLMRHFKLDRSKPVDSLVGEVAVVLEEVSPGGVGKAELRGTSWSARSDSSVPLTRGQRCRVERIEGLTLWIRAE
jgi:membrane protein implicated in regulation of membrane protease activity